jgi:hypothetical protein
VRGGELHGFDADVGAHVQRHGTCQTATTSMCDPFVCASASACRMTCTVDADCVSPNICMGGVCTKRPNGATCSAGRRLRERHLRARRLLRDGVHRDLQVVRARRLAGDVHEHRRGTAAGPGEPVRQQGAGTCGTDGTCNGAGACRLYGQGTICVAPACASTTMVRPREPATAPAPARP